MSAATQSKTHSSNISSSSVNKGWEDWVVAHGKEDVVAADVQSLGKVLGVIYQCDTGNSFNLLSREGRREWRSVFAGDRRGGEEEGARVEVV
jgi:hypothetical protein